MIGLFPQLVARISAKVHTKLLVAFLGIVVMFAALGGVGLGVLHQSHERTESLIRAQDKIAAYRLLQRNITEQLYTVSSVMLTTDDRILGAAIRQLNHMTYEFEHAEYLGNEDAESLARIQQDYSELIQVGTHIIELIREGKLAEARQYQEEQAIPLANSLERMTNALANRAEANMIASAESSKRGFLLSQYAVFGVALAAVLFALLLGYSISLSLVGPVRKMNQRFQEIAQGNFSGSVDVDNRDEMGDLASSLNDMSRELGRLYREIQAASRHKSEFLANMSHELRTPLNAIIGFSEMLDEQLFGELNEKQLEYVRDIHESGEHLLSLINDILDLSKIEAGRMQLDLKQFDVRVALENAVTLVKERSLRHGIELKVDIDPKLDQIVADERKFKQIMLNLLSNAIKFTPEGGSISIAAASSEANLEVRVTDTGIGISPEDQRYIFEEFRQVTEDASQALEGTGLGLTLTKKFVEMHGGSIEVRSRFGEGSTFIFSIPMQAQPQSEEHSAAAVEQEPQPRASNEQ